MYKISNYKRLRKILLRNSTRPKLLRLPVRLWNFTKLYTRNIVKLLCLPVRLRIFTKVLKPIVNLTRSQRIRMVVYLDDLLIMASQKRAVKAFKFPDDMLNKTRGIFYTMCFIMIPNVRFFRPDVCSQSRNMSESKSSL